LSGTTIVWETALTEETITKQDVAAKARMSRSDRAFFIFFPVLFGLVMQLKAFLSKVS
jgi:hypothetical protein